MTVRIAKLSKRCKLAAAQRTAFSISIGLRSQNDSTRLVSSSLTFVGIPRLTVLPIALVEQNELFGGIGLPLAQMPVIR